jgi:L-seryl-tRNA(Ser) seleniumtransferase
MKVGREEMVGMVVAVENWVKRDHAAEWKEWIARCEYIAGQLSKIAGVTADVQREPEATLSNRSPRLTIKWDSQKLGITGPDVADILYNNEPRIALAGSRGPGQSRDTSSPDSSIAIVASMMAPGDEKIVAQRIHAVLSAKHTLKQVEPQRPPAANVAGAWQIDIQYAASKTTHRVQLQQNGNHVEGIHQGNFLTRDISGTINGDVISLASVVTERHGDALNYRFTGKLTGDTMSGSLDLGEYLSATWTATRPTTSRGV